MLSVTRTVAAVAAAGSVVVAGTGTLVSAHAVTPATVESAAAPAAASPAPGKRCVSKGRGVIDAEVAWKCVKKGKRLVWRIVAPTTTLTLRTEFHSNDPAARMEMTWGTPGYGHLWRQRMGPGGSQKPWPALPDDRCVFRVRDITPGPAPAWRQVTLTCTVYRDGLQPVLTRTSTGGGTRAGTAPRLRNQRGSTQATCVRLLIGAATRATVTAKPTRRCGLIRSAPRK